MGIVANVLRKFHGGVHPPEHKNLSEHCAIEALPMPKRLYVPLHQSLGRPCEPCVKPGDKVLKGQTIGTPQGFVSAPVHAPTSGTIADIGEHPVGHPSGLTMLCAELVPDGEDQWVAGLEGLPNPLEADPKAIRSKILAAGIVGMGGATFPSHVKMSPPKGKTVELLIINGVECEPYLTCDARLMEERPREVLEGIQIMLRALETRDCVIGIENNKPGAIKAMQEAVAGQSSVQVKVLPVMYPQGSEKQLIEVITGRQVPSGGLPVDVGVVVHNVATALAIRDAVRFGKPLISRVVTVSGQGIARPANLEVLIGTPLTDLIGHCQGLKPGVKKILSGGPMMGVALKTTDIPVVKGTSGVLALLDGEIATEPERPCIRCGTCLTVCPIGLMPTQMAWLSRNEQWDAIKDYNLFDCIECGSCSYACPSHLPLVHYFRFAKMAIGAKDREKQKGDRSKARTKAKEARVEREKAEKERKKAEMKAQMAAKKGPAATTTPKPAAKTEGDGDDKAARAAKASAAAKAAKAAAKATGDAAATPEPAPATTTSEPLAPAPPEPVAMAAGGEQSARAAKAAKAAAAAKAAKAARAARQQAGGK
ncbi:MAG: electron transport complex subunit RsxC [Magnetococcales bacterium]|nr:electron transport complex subunit RsxC [Magnetococcales bacterium]